MDSPLDRHTKAVQRVTAAAYVLALAQAEAAVARAEAVSELQAQNRDEFEIAALLGEDLVR